MATLKKYAIGNNLKALNVVNKHCKCHSAIIKINALTI